MAKRTRRSVSALPEHLQGPSFNAATVPWASVQITMQMSTADAAKDYQVTRVFHTFTSAAPATPADWLVYCNSVLGCFTGTSGTPPHVFSAWQGYKVTAKAYDMTTAEPRPVMAESVYTPSSWTVGSFAPRALAVPLRYYSTRNLPSQRGRIFVGGWLASAVNETVDATRQTMVANLGLVLAAIAPTDAMWVLYSSKTNLLLPITNFWVNDLWASVRSREKAEVTRTTGTVSPVGPTTPIPVPPDTPP